MAFNAQAGESQAYSLQGASSSLGAPDDGRYQTQYQQYDQQAYGQADPLEGDSDGPIASLGDVTRTLGFLGAVASLALIVGVGVWGYKLVARDVSGVPVVRSLEGPMRVQPENPGGQAAVNQGLAVNAVAANGIASDPADRLILAPSSLRLTEDDVPVVQVVEAVISGSAAPVRALNDAGQDAGQGTESAATRSTEIDALVAALTAGVTPLTTTSNRVGATLASASASSIVQPTPLLPVRSEAAVAAPAVLNAPGVKVSLRPLVRPARFSPSLYSASASQGRSTLEVDAASLPAGTRLAQLGAYESAEVARAEWDRIYGRFEDYLEGKKRVIQKAQSGGRTFYRLRAMGFADLSGARRFCATLVADKADCIPVTTR